VQGGGPVGAATTGLEGFQASKMPIVWYSDNTHRYTHRAQELFDGYVDAENAHFQTSDVEVGNSRLDFGV
jgi:hypothetical protein